MAVEENKVRAILDDISDEELRTLLSAPEEPPAPIPTRLLPNLPKHIPDEPSVEEARVAPAYQGNVYVIMWKSNRSGGTYTEVRKSIEGLHRFLRTLEFMGFDMGLVTVIEEHKPWVPVKKAKEKPAGASRAMLQAAERERRNRH